MAGNAGPGVPAAGAAARAGGARVDLAADYPHLAEVVRTVLSLTLDQLADRCPCEDYPYFDLERLLAAVRDSPLFNDPEYTMLSESGTQVRGYLATLDEYVGLGILGDPTHFVTKKLLAPLVPLAKPPSAEMLDTLAECSWGLWLRDQHGNLEETRKLPGNDGDADFYVDTIAGPLWVDCMSLESSTTRDDILKYVVPRVRSKWRHKFGRRGLAANLPAAIAVSLHKGQGAIVGAMVRDEIVGTSYDAPPQLWTDCAGLRHVWLGLPPWHARPQRPTVIATWTRP